MYTRNGHAYPITNEKGLLVVRYCENHLFSRGKHLAAGFELQIWILFSNDIDHLGSLKSARPHSISLKTLTLVHFWGLYHETLQICN